MDCNDTIISATRHNDVGVYSITEHVDVAHCALMRLRNLDGFSSVDVPKGQGAILTSTNDQRVVPLESQAGVFMAFEQTVYALQSAKIPNQ